MDICNGHRGEWEQDVGQWAKVESGKAGEGTRRTRRVPGTGIDSTRRTNKSVKTIYCNLRDSGGHAR